MTLLSILASKINKRVQTIKFPQMVLCKLDNSYNTREQKRLCVLTFRVFRRKDSRFICMHSFFWCRKINLNGDKKTANERVEFHKAKRHKKVCFDFKLLTPAGQGG